VTQQTIGRYRILDVLGQGGMAVVYRAYDNSLNREVALKLLAGHLVTDSAFFQRFEREARIVATLEHPAIVPVYDYGIDEQRRPYLVMRLLRGGTLRERWAAGKLAGADLWPAMRQVAAALDYAHAGNVIHRDVKPVNILFDEKGNAYVSDFGIAKVRDVQTAELTGNAILGTPAYMSPEQFESRPVEGRSDQYSLAVVLFEALTGRLPFDGGGANVLMNQHLNERPPDAHALNTALPPAVSAVFTRALAKEPATRYHDVTTFVQELEAASYQRTQPAAPGVRPPNVEQQRLEGYYQAGLLAYRRTDWSAAVAYLGRVTTIDTGYRDAAKLRQMALQRLQDKRNEPAGAATVATPRPAPPAAPGAGGEPAAPARSRRPVNRRLLIVLVVAVMAVALFLIYLFRPVIQPPPTSEATVTEVTPESIASPGPGGEHTVRVVAGQEAAVRVAGQTTPLANGDKLVLAPGRPARVSGGEGVTELVLPDSRVLYLAEGAALTLAAAETGEIAVVLESGRLLARGNAAMTVQNTSGGWATLNGAGLLGVYLDPATLLFEVACLAGACSLSGESDAAATALQMGQGALVGTAGRAGPPESAGYAPYAALAPGLVPTPTATPTRTPAPTATATRTPRPYVGETITATAQGTPDATQTKLYSDEDLDGVKFHSDRCPDRHGPEENEGCPPEAPFPTPTGIGVATTSPTPIKPTATEGPTPYAYP